MSSKLLSAVSALVLIVGTGFGIWKLMPPMDYLPAGNRNIVFGMLMPPPALQHQQTDRDRAAGGRHDPAAVGSGGTAL
ncbi:MAG: hypothetical protein R3F17_08670 [Planctomycetota bacterium]